MNRTAIFDAAGQLMEEVKKLADTTASQLGRVEDVVCRPTAPQPGAPSPYEVVGEHVKEIGKQVEEVMMYFDVMCKAVGQRPHFEVPLDVVDAPGWLQLEVRQLISRHTLFRYDIPGLGSVEEPPPS
jgi:hypothetical protein